MTTTRESLCIVIFAFLAGAATATPPELVNYQGRLLMGTNLVNQAVSLQLRLLDSASGGNLLYEDSNTVTVVDGLYATYLGDNTTYGNLTNALANAEVYVEVVVNGQALTPRERLASVPYALSTVPGPCPLQSQISTMSDQIQTLNSYTNQTLWRDGRYAWTGTDNHNGNIITNAVLYGSVVAPTASISSLQVDSLVLVTSVWDDVTVPLLSAKTPTANAAVVKKMTVITGEIYQTAFEAIRTAGNEQAAMFSIQLPHTYKRGTPVYPHLHCIPADTNAGTVVWTLEYVASPITGSVVSVSTTLFMTNTFASSPQLPMMITGWTPIPGTTLHESSCIFGRITRYSRSGGGDTYNNDIFAISFDMHYEVNSIGSTEQLPK